jgi:hypothetical protein
VDLPRTTGRSDPIDFYVTKNSGGHHKNYAKKEKEKKEKDEKKEKNLGFFKYRCKKILKKTFFLEL